MRNNILKSDLEPVIDLLKSEEPKLTSGPNVESFEREWSDWLGCKYSVFVNSGSSANLLCIALLKEKYPEGGKDCSSIYLELRYFRSNLDGL